MGALWQAADRTVVDWEGQRVGVVRGVVRHPRTGEPQSLLIGLSPEARAKLGSGALTASVPIGFIAAVRREELTLDRSILLAARRAPTEPPRP